MSDEIMQDLDRLLRTGFTVAAQLAEQHRRGMAEADRQRRDADLAARQAGAEEAKAVQQAARAHYDKIGWADWRDNATLDDWAAAYQHAHAMRTHDPLAATAHNRIEDEVRRRYNVDIREALELHLQQLAEDQRIRAERDANHAADRTDRPGDRDGASDPERDARGARTSTADRDAGSGAADDAPTSGTSVRHDQHDGDRVVIAGEVVSDEEMAQARASTKAAARGFGQHADDAVRHSRGRSTPASRVTPERPRRAARRDADLTRSR